MNTPSLRRRLGRFSRAVLWGIGLALPTSAGAQDSTAATIRALVADARIPEAHWPSFSRYTSSVAQVYAERGDAPIWLGATAGATLSHAAREAIDVLQRAGDHGLDPHDYDAGLLDSVARHLTPADRAWVDVLLTVDVLRYVDDLRMGRLHPAPLSHAIRKPPLDLGAALRDAVAGDSIARLVAAVVPPLTQYRRLQQALAAYRRRAADSGDTPRVRQHIRQIELALERLRWLPPIDRQRFVVVNIPAFELFAFDSTGGPGAPSLRMKVIVGKAFDRRTPVLVEQMRSIEFRPYWNVPRSILVQEILPLLRRNPGYLHAGAMELVTPDGRAVGDTVTATVLSRLERGELWVRQRPSARNALGAVKFVFPNAADVYLHDTPQTGLFARSRRDFSHGCIRVEHPAALATWILRDETGWTPERVRAAMTDSVTRRVSLTRPVVVILFYTTAVVEPDGRVAFFDDLYGHDRRLDQMLRAGPPQ